MATGNSWKAETKTAAKRILIGVITAVVTTAAIYFLGFESSAKKADEAEVRKNSIRVWKEFVKLENGVQPRHDTVFARAVRSAITVQESKRLDSLISTKFIDSLRMLSETPDIDKDLLLLLQSRIDFKEQEQLRSTEYKDRFIRLNDTLAPQEYKLFLVDELNKEFDVKRNNAVERLGHTLEDLLNVMAKRHKYPFQLKDLNWYPAFLQLRTVRREEIRPDDAPPPM
jgi:hypothetical protein